MEYYEEILKLDSKDHQALKNLAYIFYLKDDNDKARKYLDRILEEHRDSFVSKIEGLILVKENQREKAHEKFREAIQLATAYDKNLFELTYGNLEVLSKKDEFKKVMDESVEKFSRDKKFIIYHRKIIGDEFNDWSRVSRAVGSYLVYNRGDKEMYDLLAYSYKRIADLNKLGLTQEIIEKKFKKSKEDGVVKE
jgi:tetratricopeptide (TPR) repeat protein